MTYTMLDADGRVIDDDAFDENGGLKDGRSIKLPVRLFDSAGCIVDDAFRRRKKVTQRDPRGREISTFEEEEDDAMDKRRNDGHSKEEILRTVHDVVCREARAEMIDHQVNAWRGPDYKPPTPAAPGKPSAPLQDVTMARDAVENARNEMIADTCSAWRRQW
jgi:hypothetical protein